MKAKSTKQHYVPQLYLREFSANRRQIQVYNLHTSKAYKSSISDCCCQRDFYTIRSDIFELLTKAQALDDNVIDEIIKCGIEELCAPIIRKFFSSLDYIIKNIKPGFYVSDDVIDVLFSFMIVQFARTPAFRTLFIPLVDDMIKLMPQDWEKTISYEDLLKLEHSQFIYRLFKGETNHFVDLSSLYHFLRNSCRVFLYNQSNKNFITSDNPVCIESSVLELNKIDLVYFPLSMNISFVLFDSDVFPSATIYDRKIIVVDESNIRVLDNFNLLIVDQAHNVVIGENIDIKHIQRFINHEINMRTSLIPPT